MKILFKSSKVLASLLVCFTLGTSNTFANDNQTDTLSPVLANSGLPFRVLIQQAGFQLPVGVHSGVVGQSNGLWVFIAGRTNGLHGFGSDPFPPDQQSTSIYVVNPMTGTTQSRSLKDPSSGLNQQQIDSLSVTSPQGYQLNDTLYMTGGYGIDTGASTYTTKPILTAFNLSGIIRWVQGSDNVNGVQKNIRQLANPIFQITGGRMYLMGSTTNLVFGQNFSGVYTDDSNGIYSEQVRQFRIIDDGKHLGVVVNSIVPKMPDPNFRRRDLNVVPVLQDAGGLALTSSLVAFAGVFTPLTGVWTVPVIIGQTGNPTMANPN
ncbi:MAG: hypothetical protein ACYCQI_07135, partial [Gammaproteobacteria bacterium]